MSINQNREGLESNQLSIQEYLVKRSKQGDREAQGELYTMYVNAMFNTARRLLGNEDDARDITQDSFIQAFAKIGGLKNEITFGAWIKRIVINNSINAIKKRKNITNELDENIDLHQEPGPDLEYQSIEAKKIMNAIENISAGCRTVLNLYLFEGYDHKEIAKILGISESASKAQYSKAKSKVRKLLS